MRISRCFSCRSVPATMFTPHSSPPWEVVGEPQAGPDGEPQRHEEFLGIAAVNDDGLLAPKRLLKSGV